MNVKIGSEYYTQERSKLCSLCLNIYLAAPSLSCSDMWDLVPWSRIEPQPPALGTLNLSHWTSREGPPGHFSLPLPTTDEYLVWKAIWALKILQTTEFYHYKNIWSLTIWKICQRQRWIFYLCITRHLFACQCDFTRHLMDWDHCFPKCDV